MPARWTRRFRSPWLWDALLLLGLAWWGWRVFAPLEQVVNIELFDETGDLWAALRLPWWAYPPEYGPLYRLWYRLLALAQPDPLALYYTSYRWVGVLVPLAVYWALRRHRVARGPAFWSAALLLMTRGHSVVWPRISIFWALVFALAWGAVGPRLPKAPAWLALLYGGWVLLWSAFARPEMFLPGATLAALGLGLGAVRRFPRREDAAWALLASVALPLLLWGVPYRQGRLLLAFRQHFVVVRSQMGDPIEHPWTSTSAIDRYFSDTTSLTAMLRERPDLIAAHLRFNLAQWPERLIQVVVLPGNRVFNAAARTVKARWAVLLAIGAAPGLLTWAAAGAAWLRRRQALRCRPGPTVAALLPLAAVVAVVGASSVLIYPHLHYLYMLAYSLLLAWAVVFGRPQATWRAWRLRSARAFDAAWLLGLLLLAAWLWRGHDIATWIPRLKDPERRVATVARFVRQLNLPADRTLYTLGTLGEWEVYFGPQFVSADDAFRQGKADLAAFLAAQPVDVLLIASPDDLPCTAHPADPATCRALLQQPERWGYRAYPLTFREGGPLTLLVRQALLPTDAGGAP